MSLFADSRYQWRETYFVLFDRKHRPKVAHIRRALEDLAPRLEIREIQGDAEDLFESMTVLSHADAAGMDIIFVEGEEVKEQIAQLKQEWRGKKADAKERLHLDRVTQSNARYDVFHFEEFSDLPDEEDDGPLDPGTLLLVLNRLAKLCHGEALDPQTGELLD